MTDGLRSGDTRENTTLEKQAEYYIGETGRTFIHIQFYLEKFWQFGPRGRSVRRMAATVGGSSSSGGDAMRRKM